MPLSQTDLLFLLSVEEKLNPIYKSLGQDRPSTDWSSPGYQAESRLRSVANRVDTFIRDGNEQESHLGRDAARYLITQSVQVEHTPEAVQTMADTAEKMLLGWRF